MEETVLFVVTLSDELARKHRYKAYGEIENDADFYFLLPHDMREYNPEKIIWVLEPRAFRHPNVGSFVEDWYLFEGVMSVEELVYSASKYAPYICLLRLEGESLDTLESINALEQYFTSVHYSRFFDSCYDESKEIVPLSQVLLKMEVFHKQYQPFLKTQEQSLGQRTAC